MLAPDTTKFLHKCLFGHKIQDPNRFSSRLTFFLNLVIFLLKKCSSFDNNVFKTCGRGVGRWWSENRVLIPLCIY